MLKRISVLIVGLFAAQAMASSQPKIVGGVVADVGEFPFIASLQQSGFGHFCGGSLIAKHWVLTAAHCVADGAPDQIIIGMHNQADKSGTEIFTAKKTITHPQYNDSNQDYDYALIELDHDSSFQPVALNSNKEVANTTPMATVAGWGVTAESSQSIPNDLMKVDVPLVTNQTCDTAYPGKITDRMVCAGYAQGGKDACQGDSGGPLMVKDSNGNDILVGIVSWGDGCAEPNKYGVYTAVAAGADWIAQTAAQ